MRHHNDQRLNFPLLSTLIAAQDLLPNCLREASLPLVRSFMSLRGRTSKTLLPAPAAAATSHGMFSTGHKLEPLEQLRQSRWRYTAGALPKVTCWQAHARAKSCSANRFQLHSVEATQVFTEKAPATQVSVASALFLDMSVQALGRHDALPATSAHLSITAAAASHSTTPSPTATTCLSTMNCNSAARRVD